MNATFVCQACGAMIPAEGTSCPVCGWVVRGPGPAEPLFDVLWPDDEALARQIEEATQGEYEIDGLIGRGGMATVYLARELALERPVAIKVMAPHLMRSPGMAERFKREARVAAGLSHQNIIPIHAVREYGPVVCLVMKRLAGRSLDAILREHRPLPLPMAQLIARDVAAGLEHAHGRGVIHRDVKPANILVDESGEVVVTDFGIAKAREADALTQSGNAIGTPAYMSPEQAMGRRATPASDQYSLGVVVYELLSGRMPFESETAMGLMYQHTHTPPEPLGGLRPDLPPEVTAAVARMLAKVPEERFASVSDASRALGIPATLGSLDDPVRRALAEFARHSPPTIRRSGTRSALRSGPRSKGSDPNATTLPFIRIGDSRRRQWFVSGVVILFVTLAGAAVMFRDRAGAPPAVGAPDPSATVTPDSTRPRAATPPVAPRAKPPAATVAVAIERHRRAVESGSIAQVLVAYPSMGLDQIESYRTFFRTSDRIRFEVVIKDLEVKDGEARMELEGFLRFHDRTTRKEEIRTYGTRARLLSGPTGWRILEIKE